MHVVSIIVEQAGQSQLHPVISLFYFILFFFAKYAAWEEVRAPPRSGRARPPDTLTCNCWKLHGALMVHTLQRAARHSRNWAFVTAAANRSIMEIVGFQVPRTWNVCGSQKLEPRCGGGGCEMSQTLACCPLQAPPTPTRGRPRGWDVTLRPVPCALVNVQTSPRHLFQGDVRIFARII